MAKNLTILQINKTDAWGGAAKIAYDLSKIYIKKGYHSWLLVSEKVHQDDHILTMRLSCWEGVNLFLKKVCVVGGRYFSCVRKMGTFFHYMARPKNYFRKRSGLEQFAFPETHRILDFLPERPDIIHCHNLHSNYFDLRFLPEMSSRVSVLLTLHDAWLLSGYCAHAINCDRWRTGCGKCQYLATPSIRIRNATAKNWKIKEDIFARSRLYVATPSQWLMDKVDQSMLKKAIIDARVIYNGIDTGIFRPEVKSSVRKQLSLPNDAHILLFVAHMAKTNEWKDFALFKKIVDGVGQALSPKQVVGICVGDTGACERMAHAEIYYAGYIHDDSSMAQYYQAADIYIHTTHVDTFPSSVLEALATGIPVIATRVGGIPEQIRSLDSYGEASTGLLVKQGDEELSVRTACLWLQSPKLYTQLSQNAIKDVFQRFNLEKQASCYLNWYEEICVCSLIKSGEYIA